LRAKLKKRVLGWAVIERVRKKQCSRINNLCEGDANTKYFHRKVIARRRKNFIQQLRTPTGWALSHQDKQDVVMQHFTDFLSSLSQRTQELNWETLALPKIDLTHLDKPFEEAEIVRAISQLPPDCALGPDGYTGIFFGKCWHIIRGDAMAAIYSLHALHCGDLNLLNKSNIVLVPKKDGAENVSDYRPIILIHAIAKIITKALALRLVLHVHSLISPCQSTFIKGRSIHDNFLYVRNIARRFHRNKSPTLLVKLDISKV
jgi:mannosylglycoprotein endo-beta-mannosidase